MGTALITGASAGLGYEFAKLFAADGHSLILVARRKDLLQKLADEIKAKTPDVHIHILSADLSAPQAGRDLYKKVGALGVHIDFLVNNAGFGGSGKFIERPLDGETQMIDLNVRALVELTHLFLPAMLAERKGHVLNIGSTAGFQPGPYMATYFATKAFVNSFSEALAEELTGTGVSCTVLAPGATATEFAKVADVEKSKLFTMKKAARADEVARLGYRAMMGRKTLVIHGLVNNLVIQSLRISPRKIVRKITASLNSK